MQTGYDNPMTMGEATEILDRLEKRFPASEPEVEAMIADMTDNPNRPAYDLITADELSRLTGLVHYYNARA